MEELKNFEISLKEVKNAEKVVRENLNQSSLTFYQNLSNLIGGNIYIKHENHNPGGSFKIRGGLNLMHHIKNHGINGVITFTTGNHGISVATAAKIYDIDATVVVPMGNNPVKNQMIKDAGAKVIEAGKNFEEAAKVVKKLSEEKGLYFIHAADEPHLINGVGTEFLEILRDLPNIDVIILPIGGGSELAGAVTVFKELKPEVEIIAVQAEASKAAYLSWKDGKIRSNDNKTFAGGFATGTAFKTPFEIYKNQLSDFILLSENEIKEGMALSLKYCRNLAEGSGASTLMAALKIKDKIKGKNVVLQMSGANCDEKILKEVINNYM